MTLKHVFFGWTQNHGPSGVRSGTESQNSEIDEGFSLFGGQGLLWGTFGRPFVGPFMFYELQICVPRTGAGLSLQPELGLNYVSDVGFFAHS